MPWINRSTRPTGHDAAVDAVVDQFRRATGIGGDDRRLERHGFEHRVGRALVVRRLHEQVERVIRRPHVVGMPNQRAALRQPKRLDLRVERVTLAAIADDEQPGVGPPWHARRRRLRSAGRSVSAVRGVPRRQWRSSSGPRPSASRGAYATSASIATELPRVDAVQHRGDARRVGAVAGQLAA